MSRGAGGERSRMWMIYVAVAVDLTSDGLMIGTGSAVSPGLAPVLAAGQVLADVPEGYATAANFRDKGVPRRTRILLSATFVLYSLGAAFLAYFSLREAPQGLKMAALIFVAGMLTVAAVEEMLEEAHDAQEDNRLSVVAFLAGFALFTLVSAGLETVIGKGGRPERSEKSRSGASEARWPNTQLGVRLPARTTARPGMQPFDARRPG